MNKMPKSNTKILFLLSTFYFLFSFSIVFAQYTLPVDLPAGLSNQEQLSKFLNKIEFDVSNFSPAPGGTFAIKVRGDSTLNTMDSEIFWYLDGKIQESGKGQDKFSFKVGDWGATYEVKVVIKTPNNRVLQGAYKFQVADLNLSWRAETAKPKDYQGISLPTPGSFLRVSAQSMLPVTVTETIKGKKITKVKQEDPTKLFYRWFLDDKIKLGSLGWGNDEFTFKVSLTPDLEHRISLEVENADKTLAIRKSLNIKVMRPQILLYQVDGVTSLLPENLILILKKGETAGFLAQPYFFGARELTDLDFSWLFNGKKIEGTPVNPNRLTLVIPGKGNFIYNQPLSLTVTNKQNIFQRAGININIKIE